jgi:hypothetical protein
VIVALDAATVWGDVAIPLLLAFLGGAIAIFWPWLQSLFRRRKFQGIIRRELAEVGPEPPSPVEGKPWWEHLTKRFVHEEAFARERLSENRDFLLSLNPTVVYRVSQLWIAFAKRDGRQWLGFIGELATDRRVGTKRLREAHQQWQDVMEGQPEELKAPPRVRGGDEIEGVSDLYTARLNAYQSLLPLTSHRSRGKRTSLTGKQTKTTLTPKERQKRADDLTAWFYSGGGLLLSGDAHNAFQAARSRLEDEQPAEQELIDALSALRTELKIDLSVRHPDERHVPMAPSQQQRAWD